MRSDHAPDEEERYLSIIANKFECLVGKKVICINFGFSGIARTIFADGGDYVRQGFFRFISPEIIGKVVVGVVLATLGVLAWSLL